MNVRISILKRRMRKSIPSHSRVTPYLTSFHTEKTGMAPRDLASEWLQEESNASRKQGYTLVQEYGRRGDCRIIRVVPILLVVPIVAIMAARLYAATRSLTL